MIYTQPKLFWGDPVLTIIIDITPIVVLFILLAGLKLSAWKATLISSIFTLLLAFLVGAPPDQTMYAWLIGALFGLWSISWLIFWGITWFNTWRLTGHLDAFTSWLLRNIVNDIRVLSLALAWALGALIEGLIGFGTPWAYIVPMLISLGLPSLRAITVVAVANTAPVSYGAFGLPIITIAGVTGLPLMFMSSVAAHIVAVLSFFITFILLYVVDGWRGIREVWPFGLVGAFGYVIGQYTTAVYMGPYLADVIGSILSFIFIIAFSKIWKPKNIIKPTTIKINNIQDKGIVLKAWISLVVFIAVMGLWNSPISPMKLNLATFSVSAYSEVLEKKVSVSYTFNLLATGTSALVAWLITIPIMGANREVVAKALRTTLSQTWGAVLTGIFVISLAFVFNFSGMAYSLAYLASGLGIWFIFISPFLGWLGAALTGSNTSSNALFGPFQAAMGTLLGLPQGLLPGLQTIGGELGKPVAPQTVSAGVSTTEYVRREGEVIRNNLKYSIGLVFLLLLIGIAYLTLYPYPFILHGK
ncbi:L-lactate permease [Pyrobaculum islandicum DSM 4184]|uniref:L-lactate permease n=1 Tax=Pyrobaculum islandicum (strain DSM 4184 / JCM 9189 / GEO3) TaxID=384616 RepID=A1RU78_PYRIL|nr:L-lactate permease [Pyrobaculum islandicum]ABL88510.1 L-lactate permease [Pyrobaculum islandicum DSM 4184]